MAAAPLFSPLRLRSLVLPNRIVVSPMCMYSSVDGKAQMWHNVHLGSLLNSGAGTVIIEATGVCPEGRITPVCLGLYNDETEKALAKVLAEIRPLASPNVVVGIQLAHAGRKGSTRAPWEPEPGSLPLAQGGWTTVAPSAIPFDKDHAAPHALTKAEIEGVVQYFVAAAERARRCGIQLIEIHAAHGYLLSSFLSPLANQRTDEYGGSLENRMRLPLEVFTAVRKVWPEELPIGVRVNGTDWDPAGWKPEEAVVFATKLKALGCDYVDVSSGGNKTVPIPLGLGYQVPFAKAVKATGIPTMAVGMIVDAHQANDIVANGDADLVALARPFLLDPHWAWKAAETLQAKNQATPPKQYERAVGLARWVKKHAPQSKL
eukprot:TRINITY_DN1753_c0_g1_i1.p1 TRINITY_DN1753_c0_g1~~TRINITY_DN1753_c0_g1_i1.p1  ORF type:complete len:382 (-),score=62.80 TRINITY_DN1753_c0_g1_i1:34-1158(-)